MVGQFSLEVNRKDEPAVRRRPPLLSSKPAEMRAFYSGADSRCCRSVAAARMAASTPSIKSAAALRATGAEALVLRAGPGPELRVKLMATPRRPQNKSF